MNNQEEIKEEMEYFMLTVYEDEMWGRSIKRSSAIKDGLEKRKEREMIAQRLEDLLELEEI